jgi:hypothetical protein
LYFILIFILSSGFLIVYLNIWRVQAATTIIFVGTYSGDGSTDSKGIYAFLLDENKSILTPLGLSVETTNASYVFVHPSHMQRMKKMMVQ